MLIDVCSVSVDASRRELQIHGTPDFPCAAYEISFLKHGPDDVPWHWHDELEFTLVMEGEPEFRAPGLAVSAGAGDCFCVNSNTLHSIVSLEDSVTRSVVFSAELVSGGAGTVFSQRYVRPLLDSPGFTGVLLRGGEHPEASSALRRVFRAMADEEPGYEFAVREGLSELCLTLSRLYVGASAAPEYSAADMQRVRAMLAYIHENFASPIRMPELAEAANVSQRECERVFRRVIGMTPKQYLIKYRVDRAAAILAGGSGKNISEIALECGFSGINVFGRTFKDYYGLSAREYKKSR